MGLRIADIASHLRSALIAFAHAAVKARIAVEVVVPLLSQSDQLLRDVAR